VERGRFIATHNITPAATRGHQGDTAGGTRLDLVVRMTTKDTPTLEMSLEMLSDAVGKASEDLRAVRATLDLARGDIASRNTSMSRTIVKDAERAIERLRQADECLRDVLKDLRERD
jgi:hypothetical protein